MPTSVHPTPDLARFTEVARDARRSCEPGTTLVIPVAVALLDDQLTPVLAYRRLVAPDERTAPSFLLESVEGGERQGRHSILGAQPALEVVARGHTVRVRDHRGERAGGGGGGGNPSITETTEADPLDVLRRLLSDRQLVVPGGVKLPACFLGGWVGYAGYDSVRYVEPGKLDFSSAPPDDRGLADLQFAYYDGVVVFDHVDKLVYVIRLIGLGPDVVDDAAIGAAYASGAEALRRRVEDLRSGVRVMASGRMDLGTPAAPPEPLKSNMTRSQHAGMVARALEYIRAGDIFQVVLGQRFERRSEADPFEVYRALRAVNPSPYMVYLQAEGTILIASSPEILCRVRAESDSRRILTNRPLAGTRRRGKTPGEDAALEQELLADPKERAEHVMLVDLGRNDVGRVAVPGSIRLPSVMSVERYSHVMHISSTVTGELRPECDHWDALRATLPVGTISGAPKIRAMQVIDELEPVRRGPYGGGIGCIGLDGQMDIALALRTIVVPVDQRVGGGVGEGGDARGTWMYHLQASGGIVADSDARAEYEETVNKAAALARAVLVAERAFGSGQA